MNPSANHISPTKDSAPAGEKRSNAQNMGLGYFFGDLPILIAGVLLGNNDKVQSGIWGLLNSFFFGIDKSKQVVNLDTFDKHLDDALKNSVKDQHHFIASLPMPPWHERIFSTVREYGVVLGSFSMVAGGVKMVQSAFKHVGKGIGSIVWGDLFNGILNVAGFGLTGLHALCMKHPKFFGFFGIRFAEPDENYKPLDFNFETLADPKNWKKLLYNEPSKLGAVFALGSSASSLVGGAQIALKENVIAGGAQILGAAAYIHTESQHLPQISQEQKSKHQLNISDNQGNSITPEKFYDVLFTKMQKNHLLEKDNHALNDHNLKKMAIFCAAQPDMPLTSVELSDQMSKQLIKFWHTQSAQPKSAAA